MAAANQSTTSTTQEKRHRSVFETPSDLFDSCRLISPTTSSSSTTTTTTKVVKTETKEEQDKGKEEKEEESGNGVVVVAGQSQPNRLTCNICKAEFDSLQDQRFHFKSLIHCFNVKLSIAGKSIVKEDDFDELTSDSFRDFDVSSISGSEDEVEKTSSTVNKGFSDSSKNKLFVHLKTGEISWVWKSLLLNESEEIIYEDQKAESSFSGGFILYFKESDVIEKLKRLVQEPRDKTSLRIVLLASGGHFAGCVFDGNSVVAHKTFHRYVVRAKAGKKQSSKDAGGRTIHSAGAALRRYNELGLKKEIQELLAAWTPYFDASSSIFIHAPSSNRQLLYNGEKPYFRNPNSVVRNIPFTVRRPTLKEAQRVYNYLTQLTYEPNEIEDSTCTGEGFSESTLRNDCTNTKKEVLTIDAKFSSNSETGSNERVSDEQIDPISRKGSETCSTKKVCDEQIILSESESEAIGASTALHVAARSGDADKVMELLDQGLDPCAKDELGWTPYTLAKEKEVRNTFRRFMALNLDKWDWHAAKVPSALTKEMEESQAAKQAEKDAKRKARAKELKKLRKAKEKKAQAQAAPSHDATTGVENQGGCTIEDQSQHKVPQKISKEEELKRLQAAEREKRASAAERRIAAAAVASSVGLNAQGSGLAMDISCSCCNASLAGKVPFHRYNYKYCSTACMRVHREALEDG